MGWTPEELDVLEQLFLFRGLSREEMVRALEGADHYRRNYAKGQVIYRPRDYERSLGVLLSGTVEVTKEGDGGHAMIVSVLSRGEAFGGAALFNEREDYVTTLTAREAARILFFPQPSVSALIRDPRIAENYIRYLCGRIHFLSGKIDSLIAGTGERKVAQYLLSQLEGGAEMLRLSCSLTDLAERLHMGRASLYRAFDHLSSEGILEKRGRTIQVLDLEKLQLV